MEDIDEVTCKNGRNMERKAWDAKVSSIPFFERLTTRMSLHVSMVLSFGEKYSQRGRLQLPCPL